MADTRTPAARNTARLSRTAPAGTEFVQRLLLDGQISPAQVPAAEAMFNALRADAAPAPAAPAVPAARHKAAALDAIGTLWFRLDEIKTLADCIPMVQEHAASDDDHGGRVDALARAIGVLTAAAMDLHEATEAALKRLPN